MGAGDDGLTESVTTPFTEAVGEADYSSCQQQGERATLP
jgi:hypothetical protein